MEVTMVKKHELKKKPVLSRVAEEETLTVPSAATAELTDQPVEGEQSPENPVDQSELAGQLARMEQELQKAQQEKEEYYNRLLRSQADFDNFRRRSRQEYEQACLYGGEDLLGKILPVLDSLERAVACFSDQTAENGGWQEGVQLTLRQFQTILAAEGLEMIESLRQVFDPQIHEAVLQEQNAEVKEPTVVEELQKGYKYKNKLIRPALVKVATP
jgi:molecular chaperone GrpE